MEEIKEQILEWDSYLPQVKRQSIDVLVDNITDLAVSKERSRIVERVMKDAEEKHSGHEDWEYGDCDCDSLYDYKDIINLINTK